MMRRRIEEAPGILDATLAQQGRLLMESAQSNTYSGSLTSNSMTTAS